MTPQEKIMLGLHGAAALFFTGCATIASMIEDESAYTKLKIVIFKCMRQVQLCKPKASEGRDATRSCRQDATLQAEGRDATRSCRQQALNAEFKPDSRLLELHCQYLEEAAGEEQLLARRRADDRR